MMKTEEKAFMVFLLAVTAGLTVLSFGFSTGSRMLPLVSGGFATALLLFLVFLSLRPRLADWYAKLEKQALMDMAPLTREEKKRELSVFAWFLGGVLLVYLLGFIVAIPLFLFLFLRFSARESWTICLALPAAVIAVVYMAFVYILMIPLEAGILFQ